MKKVYLSLMLLTLIAVSTTAQKADYAVMKSAVADFATEMNASDRPTNLSASSYARAEGDTIWIDGFEDAELWLFTAPSGDPDPTENGWSIGDENNSWFNFADMDTEGNYARFVNGDPTADPPTNIEDGPWFFEYDGVIDLTDVPAPQVVFEQYGARFFSEQAVQISTNDGADWVTVGTNNDIPELTAAGGDPYPNTMTRSYNITSAVADDPSNVRIRLSWDGLPGGAAPFVEYAWFVDNIRIEEGLANDLILANEFYNDYDVDNNNFFNNLEYSIYPTGQLHELTLGATITNNGSQDQTNVVLEAFITNGTFEETVTSDPITLGADTDSLITIGYTPPAEVGDYTVTYTILSDQIDGNPDNNVGETSFSISDAVYARDPGEVSFASGGDIVGEFQGYANGFWMEQDGVIHCIGAAIHEDSDVSTGDDPVFFRARLYNVSVEPIAESDEFELVDFIELNDDGDSEFTWFGLTYAVEPEEEVFAAIINESPSNGLVYVGANGTAQDGSALSWGGETADGGVCDPCGGNVPMNLIRLGMTQEFCDAVTISVDVEELEQVSNHSLFPNPTAGETTLEYTLLEDAEVQVMLFDINGRIVMQEDKGTQPVGEYRFNYNFADMATGSYTLTIWVDDKPVNKKLVIK